MHYSALILSTAESPLERTIIYETFQSDSFVVLKQKSVDNVWINDQHIAIPKAVIDFMDVFRMEQRNSGNSHENYPHQWRIEVVYEKDDLDEATKRIMHQYDCSAVPIHPNQQQTFEELHEIDRYWDKESSTEMAYTVPN